MCTNNSSIMKNISKEVFCAVEKNMLYTGENQQILSILPAPMTNTIFPLPKHFFLVLKPQAPMIFSESSFISEVFKEKDVIGPPRTVGVEACRASCYSSLNCRYWQYHLGQGLCGAWVGKMVDVSSGEFLCFGQFNRFVFGMFHWGPPEEEIEDDGIWKKPASANTQRPQAGFEQKTIQPDRTRKNRISKTLLLIPQRGERNQKTLHRDPAKPKELLTPKTLRSPLNTMRPGIHIWSGCYCKGVDCTPLPLQSSRLDRQA